MSKLKICAISDTHNRHHDLIIPECDVLIHCGDYSGHGLRGEVEAFCTWFNAQPGKNKILVQGNHELGVENNKEAFTLMEELCPGIILLHDSEVIIEGIKFYGSPWTPYFYDWAYNAGRTIVEAAHYQKPFIGDFWNKISDDTDVLITHGPPYEILDGTNDGRNVGCVGLKRRVGVVRPDLHFFGHIHHSYGEKHIDGTSFYNTAICDEKYYPSNKPMVVEYEKMD